MGDLVAAQGSTLVRIPVYGRSLGAPTSTHRRVADLRGIGDCNGDGRPDLLSSFHAEAGMLLLSAGESFIDIEASQNVRHGPVARCVDVDDDGLADLIGLSTWSILTRLSGGAP
ncbi:MAG: hypothetical protein H6710_20645 [Myxococcales bacterium]|nr:hypothetical protein [Myxococcales bacterium]